MCKSEHAQSFTCLAAMRAARVPGVALRRPSMQLVKLEDDGRGPDAAMLFVLVPVGAINEHHVSCSIDLLRSARSLPALSAVLHISLSHLCFSLSATISASAASCCRRFCPQNFWALEMSDAPPSGSDPLAATGDARPHLSAAPPRPIGANVAHWRNRRQDPNSGCAGVSCH
jgi:hypothetical protein